jgi:hypothetical protein
MSIIDEFLYILPDNSIYFDFSLFKIYARTEHYCENKLLDKLTLLVATIKEKSSIYKIHINMTTFTAKSITKYQKLQTLIFVSKILDSNEISHIIAHNTSKMMLNLLGLILNCIGHEYKDKIIIK